MPCPNTFIIGAPKCGTTSLSNYLAQHPQVYFSNPKEPLYWADDFPMANNASYCPIKNFEDYLLLFKKANASHRIIAEGTTTYLYSKTAVKRILSTVPDAKFIVMLRNPIDLAYAWHGELVYNSTEDEPNFEIAWNLQKTRSQGNKIPRSCQVPEFLQYGLVGKLGSQVKRMLDLAPRTQCHFIFMDDLQKNMRQEFLNVTEFLGLEPDSRAKAERANSSKQMRFPFVAQLFFTPPQPLAPIAKGIRRHFHKLPSPLKTRLNNFFRPARSRNILNPTFRRHLEEYFEDDILLLASLLQRDLSSWNQQRSHEQ